MFTSLKNKIKEETGSELPSIAARTAQARYQRSRPESLTSMTSVEELTILEQDAEINALRIQCQEISSHFNEVRDSLQIIEEEKNRLEEANTLLEESVKVGQVQKDLICEEQDKIQNLQLQEINKLKNMLLFREQEAIDRISHHKSSQQQVENLKNELARLRSIEPMLEDVQDEYENLRHSSQIEKNNLTSTLAAVEEENRHLKSRIQVLEETRVSLTNGTMDDKMQCLLQERKLLEQRLEEAHLHLSDIKSTWSGQNLALETQVSRLSRQVAEETTEKRKALKIRDDLTEKVKQVEFDLEKYGDEIKQRDNKITLLSEEIDELSSALREAREEQEEEVTFLNSKVDQLLQEAVTLKTKLAAAENTITEYFEDSEKSTNAFKNQILNLENNMREINNKLVNEKQEKLNTLMKNAEISQKEEILRQELRHEKDEVIELQEKITSQQLELDKRLNAIVDLRKQLDELNTISVEQKSKISTIDNLNIEIADKNKIIKILNQRLVDMKKTLQEEIKNSNNNNNTDRIIERSLSKDKDKKFSSSSLYSNCGSNGSGPIIMDEVNFRYLKHVVLKFLTSREVEARHLIRAVSTLLQLTYEEEKLLHDTLNWKMSWFGSKPDRNAGQLSFTIPPS